LNKTKPFSNPMSKAPIYVSLDLETTGLNPENDAITEIAAVKFEGNVVVDTFNSLVNPHRAIPYFVQQMCGITQGEVDVAPDLSSLVSDLKAFVGTYPIVGHNIAFDISFLAANGIDLVNPTYDTFELATIFLPELSSYSLTGVAEYFGYSYRYHRALADAEASKDVFLAIVQVASRLSLQDIAEIGRLVEGTGMSLETLLNDIKRIKAQTAFNNGEIVETSKHSTRLFAKVQPLTPKYE